MVSVGTVFRSAATRFFPTSLFLMGVGLAPLILSGAPVNSWAPLIAFSQILASALGYTGALVAVRRHLGHDTPLLGRPSITAGVVAPVVNMLALMALGLPHKSRLLDCIACAIGGGALALAMFSPWIAKLPDSPNPLLDDDQQRMHLLRDGVTDTLQRTNKKERAPINSDRQNSSIRRIAC